jgi:hypothetical protein
LSNRRARHSGKVTCKVLNSLATPFRPAIYNPDFESIDPVELHIIAEQQMTEPLVRPPIKKERTVPHG